MKENLSWILTGIGAFTVIVIGIEGSLGTLLGCIFTPSYIQVGA